MLAFQAISPFRFAAKMYSILGFISAIGLTIIMSLFFFSYHYNHRNKCLFLMHKRFFFCGCNNKKSSRFGPFLCLDRPALIWFYPRLKFGNFSSAKLCWVKNYPVRHLKLFEQFMCQKTVHKKHKFSHLSRS